MGVKICYEHNLTKPVELVHVEVIGENAAEAFDALVYLGERMGNVPWSGKISLPDAAKPVKKSDVKKNPELEPQHLKDEALKLLAETYAVPVTRAETKKVLTTFGVKKFAEIPVERAAELLDAAKAIHAKLQAEAAE